MIPDEREAEGGRQSKESPRRGENLAILYQGLLTGTVRLRAGKQHITDAESFRRRTEAAFQEVERDAIAMGYDGSDIRETHFAVVAFLDSVILSSKEPIREEWERLTMQEEMFGQRDAGVVFFEKLERLRTRRDSQELADILEVFLLCILLGFEGRYSGGQRGELFSVEDRIRSRIDDIRGRKQRISPSGLPAEQPQVQPAQPISARNPYPIVMMGAVVFTILFYVAAKVQLLWMSDHVRGALFE